MSNAVDLSRVEAAIQPLLGREGVELVDLRYAREGGGWVLRLFLDKPGGVTLADCEALSRKVGDLLDVEDVMPASYSLEVSSPGLDRVLKREADFARFAGEKIRLRLRLPREGQRNFRGRLRGAGQGRIALEPEAPAQPLEIAIADIEEARLDPDVGFGGRR